MGLFYWHPHCISPGVWLELLCYCPFLFRIWKRNQLFGTWSIDNKELCFWMWYLALAFLLSDGMWGWRASTGQQDLITQGMGNTNSISSLPFKIDEALASWQSECWVSLQSIPAEFLAYLERSLEQSFSFRPHFNSWFELWTHWSYSQATFPLCLLVIQVTEASNLAPLILD